MFVTGPDQLREKSIQPPRRGQAEKERGTVARSRFECKFNERARVEQMLSGGVCLNYSNWLIVSLSDRVRLVPVRSNLFELAFNALFLSDFSARSRNFRCIRRSYRIKNGREEKRESRRPRCNSLNSNKLVDCEFVISFGGPH